LLPYLSTNHSPDRKHKTVTLIICAKMGNNYVIIYLHQNQRQISDSRKRMQFQDENN
jgi:hypothetical protein